MITATTDFSRFKREVAFYESLGFQLSYDPRELTSGKTKRADGQFVLECDLLWSFLFEVFLVALILMLAKFYLHLKSSMAWLQKTENILKMDELKEYLLEQERLAEEAEEMAT